jgi:acetylornithine deacetylase/succinyl-diaminopimelate desuccinylase-like protein
VVAPTPAECAAAAALPVDKAYLLSHLGLAEMDGPLDRDYFERLMFHPTLTINGMHGGYDGPGMKTVIPHQAYVKCDMRLIEAQSPDNVFELIQRHVARHAPSVEVIRLNSMLPSKTPVESSYTQVIVEGVTSGQRQTPLLYPTVGASLPDYVFTKILGIPAFLVPYANADQSNHAPNENLRTECFLNGIRTGAAILDALGRFAFTQPGENS